MSEAVILGAIQKLENALKSIHWDYVIFGVSDEQTLEEIINELRMMLDFLSLKKSTERSRLNYLLADFAEMAQISVDLARDKDNFNQVGEMALGCLRMTKKRMMEFGVGKGATRPQSVGEEGVVVGLEKVVKQLIDKVILNEKSDLLISCIKGMVGVGKTVLARQIYNHPAIIEKFKLRAWVSISSDTSVHEVFMELIQQLVEVDGDLSLVGEMDNRSLQQMLRQHLQGMPYFIVIDNMLPEMRFDSFLYGLPNEGLGCRLLITSRHWIPENLFYTHEMKVLDNDKSWQLFLKTIFCGDEFTSGENKIPKQLENKGRAMLKKCGGLPAAIISVGRQKAKQRLSGIGWEELFDSIDLSESLMLLEPMYNKLDKKLKECFLHMSFFKENAIMRVKKMEQIWAASGLYTQHRAPFTYDLFCQSILEILKGSFYSESQKFHLNPLLYMLSIKKAEEEMNFEILRSNGNNQPSQSVRHLVIHCGRDKFNHSTIQNKRLVSLIYHGGGRYLDDASQSYWKGFELLKVLDLEDFGVKTLSETIGTLIGLKYLGLRNNYIREIPHSLGSLRKLEVFDIALNFMVGVPDIIKRMCSLRHLYMSNVIFRKPLRLDSLRNLKTLAYISIYDWKYKVSGLEKLTKLYKLGIEEIDENTDASELFSSMFKLKGLECLALRGFCFRSLPCLDKIGVLDRLHKIKLDGLLSRLPSANNFPPHIHYLALVNSSLDEDPMPVLGELCSLMHLKLQNAYTGLEMVIRHSGFHKLEILHINDLWNLRNVRVEEGAMPVLNELEIKNCPHLETLPREIGSMELLKKFKMVTSRHIATKVRNSGLTSKILEEDIYP